jgi:Zn-finger protein
MCRSDQELENLFCYVRVYRVLEACFKTTGNRKIFKMAGGQVWVCGQETKNLGWLQQISR